MTAALKAVAAWIGSMVIATVGLLLVNWAVRKALGEESLNLWVGLGFALLVYAVLFWAATRVLHCPRGWLAAGLTSFGFIVCLPAFLVWVDGSDGSKIRAQTPIQGKIDLVLVAPGPLRQVGTRPPAPPGDLAAWDVRYTVGIPAPGRRALEVLVSGTESRGTALRALRTGLALEPGSGTVEWREGAQRGVVLLTADERLSPAADGLDAPLFDLSAEAGAEGPTPLDSALRLVATSRSALADRQLAYAYRPLLFFDRRERFDWPVDVDAAFAEGAVEVCGHGQAGDDCDPLRRAVDLDQSIDYMKVDPRRFSAADRERNTRVAGSTYYYRVVDGPRDTKLIDYWWYLPYNPSLTAWMCSPGLGLPEFSCFDHESDWEGVTVKVGPGGGAPRAVYYAQHANVARHSWGELAEGWAGLEQASQVEAVGAYHPLAFVARASHAAYRNPCQAVFCHQYGSVLPEGRSAGEGGWPNNEDKLCAGRCLKPLPVTRDGLPATWNAFSGPWGTQTCILHGTFCDRGEAPHSPAFQWRYDHPGVAR